MNRCRVPTMAMASTPSSGPQTQNMFEIDDDRQNKGKEKSATRLDTRARLREKEQKGDIQHNKKKKKKKKTSRAAGEFVEKICLIARHILHNSETQLTLAWRIYFMFAANDNSLRLFYIFFFLCLYIYFISFPFSQRIYVFCSCCCLFFAGVVVHGRLSSLKRFCTVSQTRNR